MKIKTYQTDNDWLDLDCIRSDDATSETSNKAEQEIDRILTSMVSAKKLIVLAGLGTSMCVKEGGQVVAPTMDTLWDAVKKSFSSSTTQQGTWDDVMQIVGQPESGDIEELLSRCKLYQMFRKDEDSLKIGQFIESAEATIRNTVDFIKQDTRLPVHEAFLRRIARRSVRRDRLKVFTTNYDTCFEHAAQRAGFVVIDGFTFAQPPRFDPRMFSYDIVRGNDDVKDMELIEHLFQLYKMHGSIDWTLNPKLNEISRQSSTEKPLLIYPRNSKFELAFEQPYLEMISTFQSCLRQSNMFLLALGFGFNDTHIAEPIMSAVETNLSLNVLLVSPSLTKDSVSNSYVSRMSALIDHGDARLALIETTFEDLVPKIPDMSGSTDLIRHLERVQNTHGNLDATTDNTV